LKAGFPKDDLDRFLPLFLETIPRRMTPEEFPGLVYPKRPGSEDRFRSMAEMDESNATLQLRDVCDHINKTFGIFSLTTARDNLVMWSHYAASHKGIVVGFEADHPFFARSRDFQPVDYNEERISLPSNDGYLRLAGKHLPAGSDYRELAEQLFLRKHPDWKYEEEWRMIKRLDQATNTSPTDSSVYLFEIPHDAIKVIILGAQISNENCERIIRLTASSAKWNHVQLFQASLSDSRFGLVFREIEKAV